MQCVYKNNNMITL